MSTTVLSGTGAPYPVTIVKIKIKIYKENFNIVDKFSEKHYSPGTFDLFIGLVFALIGEPEVFNSEVTECLRNPGWQTSGHPIVHQYREYYEQSDFYGVPA